jgi:hypothetical protein
MSEKDNGGPAFPRTVQAWNGNLTAYDGMTLRDWVMGQCIAAAFGGCQDALTVNPGESEEDAMRRYWTDVAKAAAIAADAMLEARK